MRVVRKREPAVARSAAPLIVHGDGVRVELPTGADAALLTLVVEVVRTRAGTGGQR